MEILRRQTKYLTVEHVPKPINLEQFSANESVNTHIAWSSTMIDIYND